MSDQYIEKTFLYLVALSFLVHVVVFAIFHFMPDKKGNFKPEPYMVELEELPPVNAATTNEERNSKRKSDVKRRVNKETAPKGNMPVERIHKNIAKMTPLNSLPEQNKKMDRGVLQEKGKGVFRKLPRGRDLLAERKENLPEISRLYPNASRLSYLEENYRKKYETNVNEGDTKFLNTDDIQFGSFLRRFEDAVYGVWRYPTEAVRLGIEGVTPVKITFNRRGEVENIQLLESSGSKILDSEVFRTLRLIGPVGGFPKGYEKEKFYLVAFFQYGIIRGASRGVLR